MSVRSFIKRVPLAGSLALRASKALTQIREDRIRRIHDAHRRMHPDAYKRIDEIIERFRSDGGLSHHYQGYKLFELRELLAKHRPNAILELGSGTTTAIFADYARRAGASLTVVDENPHWLENSRALAGDVPGARFVACEKLENKAAWTTSYAGVPAGEYDFVLIDGPTLDIEGQANKTAVNSDIFALLEAEVPKTVLVDIRRATANALAKRPEYTASLSDILTGNVRPNYQYFSIFER